MGKQIDLYQRWKQAKQQLDDIFSPTRDSVVIHYSCESFYDRDNPASPRITSIAVRNLDTGQTKSFSIHLVAEEQGQLDRIDEVYDDLEKAMLEAFFQHVRTLQHAKWVHWNMRDVNYGFEAIEHRFRVLGGNPSHIDEQRRYDLSRILIGIYGVRYIGHPRLECLVEKNKVTKVGFMTGEEEASAFTDKEFLKLHQSTLRKVDVLANIAERAHKGDLKTLASWWTRNGRSVRACGEKIGGWWLWTLLISALTLVCLLSDFRDILSRAVAPEVRITRADNPNVKQPFAQEFLLENIGNHSVYDLWFECGIKYMHGVHHKLSKDDIKDTKEGVFKPQFKLPKVSKKVRDGLILELPKNGASTKQCNFRTDLSKGEINEINGAVIWVRAAYKSGPFGYMPFFNGEHVKEYMLRKGRNGFFLAPYVPAVIKKKP